MSPPLVGAIVLAVSASILASYQVDFRAQPRAKVQPRNEAFGIWALIFPLLLLSAAWAGGQNEFPSPSVLLLVASLACTVAWSYAVSTFRPIATFALLSAAACAWASLALLPRSRMASSLPSEWIVETAVSLYAGWLAVASALTLALARPETFDHPPILTIASIVVSVSAALLATPVAPLPVAWACLLQRTPSVSSAVGALVAVGGATTAVVRRI